MQSDETLILACRRGDAAAWEQLVRRYQRLIYTIPRRAGLDEDQAADVFQRVFAKLIEKLDTIQQPERIGAWLVTTARRESWRAVRIQRNNLPLQTDEDAEEPEWLVDNTPLPEELLMRLEARQRVRMALEALEPRCRELLSMLFLAADPPPYSEIAARLGTSEGSIGPTRARCLEKLRKILEPHETHAS